MVSNQVLGARAIAGAVVLSLALSGCALFRRPPPETPDASAAPAASAGPAAATSSAAGASSEATATPAPQEMTATESALNTSPAPATAAPVSSDKSGLLNPTAPMHYTVKQGDTLWGIASMYLKDPWLWPEVWVINPQVANPHLIYPGDKLALAYGAGGIPQVMLEQAGLVRLDPALRSASIDSSIPSIPYSAIAAFLSRPTVMTAEQVRQAPYVVAFRDLHQTGGSDNEVYLRNLNEAVPNSRFAIVHVAGPIVDPDDGKTVGYEGVYTATALVERPGEIAKAVLIDPARETLAGDRLLSAEASEVPATFALSVPSRDVHGTIIGVVNGTTAPIMKPACQGCGLDLIGQYDVVVINRGQRHGLVPGNVLAIDHVGETVRDLFRGGRSIGSNTSGFATSFAPKVKLPNERSGTLFVFRVFDRVSYGLVVGADNAIYRGDLVHTP
jgi:LysM repeat protein